MRNLKALALLPLMLYNLSPPRPQVAIRQLGYEDVWQLFGEGRVRTAGLLKRAQG